jgi:hypothetical protein
MAMEAWGRRTSPATDGTIFFGGKIGAFLKNKCDVVGLVQDFYDSCCQDFYAKYVYLASIALLSRSCPFPYQLNKHQN